MQTGISLDDSLEVSICLSSFYEIKSNFILTKNASKLKWSHAILIGLDKVFLFDGFEFVLVHSLIFIRVVLDHLSTIHVGVCTAFFDKNSNVFHVALADSREQRSLSIVVKNVDLCTEAPFSSLLLAFFNH
jgi:hypothetical protein